MRKQVARLALMAAVWMCGMAGAAGCVIPLGSVNAPAPGEQAVDGGAQSDTLEPANGLELEPTDGGAPRSPVDDGAPARAACGNAFGSALRPGFGRLDGYLRAVVAPATRGCRADRNHLHLQIEMQGALYDVAVALVSDQPVRAADGTEDRAVRFFTKGIVGPLDWSEGWHDAGVAFDYVGTLDAHAADFVALDREQLKQKIMSLLASANHVSVFATAYGDDGVHDVHRKAHGRDGALVIRPTEAAPQFLLFHFPSQGF